jgi:hypothetical protein
MTRYGKLLNNTEQQATSCFVWAQAQLMDGFVIS